MIGINHHLLTNIFAATESISYSKWYNIAKIYHSHWIKAIVSYLLVLHKKNIKVLIYFTDILYDVLMISNGEAT